MQKTYALAHLSLLKYVLATVLRRKEPSSTSNGCCHTRDTVQELHCKSFTRNGRKGNQSTGGHWWTLVETCGQWWTLVDTGGQWWTLVDT